tara:strand:- start:16442 stop:18496 length:2055 start_codon:yes stop_codon:yes gene_type:complete
MAKKITYEVEVNVGNAEKGLKKVDDGVKDIGKSTDELKNKQKGQASGRSKQLSEEKKQQEELTSEIGFMGITIGGVKSAFSKMGKTAKLAFSSIKMGLIATGIGAFLIAITSLMAYFTKTKRGAEQLRVGMAVLGGIMDKLMDTVISVGEWLVKLFTDPKQAIKDLWKSIKENLINRFKGLINTSKALGKVLKGVFTLDWDMMKEGAKDATNALVQLSTGMDPTKIKEYSQEIINTANAYGELEKRTNALKNSNRELNVEFAQQRAEVAALRLIAEDITKSVEERIDAAQRAFDIEDELMQKRVANAEEELRIQQEKMALAESSEEDFDREAELMIALANIRQESAQKQIAINVKLNSIKQQQAAEDKRLHDEEMARQKETELALEKEAQLIKDNAKKRREYQTKVAEDYDALRLSYTSMLDQELYALEEKFLNETAIIERARNQGQIRDEEYREMMDIAQYNYDQSVLQATQELANAELAIEADKIDQQLQMRLETASNILSSIESIGATATAKEMDALDKAYADGKMSEEKYNKQKEQIEKKAVKREKRMAMLKLLIDTSSAISSGIAGAMASATATGPGAVFTAPGFVASMIALALGSFAQGYAILNQVPGGGGDGPPSDSSPETSGGGNSTPAPVFNPDALLPQNMQDTNEQQPVQAYVIENDITNAQALAEELEFQATL